MIFCIYFLYRQVNFFLIILIMKSNKLFLYKPLKINPSKSILVIITVCRSTLKSKTYLFGFGSPCLALR